MIYFDHNSTTNIYPEIADFIFDIIKKPLNASSIHANGREGRKIIEQARFEILDLLAENNLKDYKVIFTSSGTEANNLILSNFLDGEIFISACEHASIFEFAKYYPNVKIIKVDKDANLDLEHLEDLLKNSLTDKKLISVMLVNNETGIIQNISKIREIADIFGAYLHSDIVQAIGKIKVDINELQLDFATISGHKFGSSAGIAALITKKDRNLKPLIIGGGQEQGIRAGTESVALIGGLGMAAKITKEKLDSNIENMRELQEYLESNLLYSSTKLNIVGKDLNRLPNTTLIIDKRKEAQTSIINLDLRGIRVSSGAACSSGKVSKSHVLTSMGFSEEEVKSAIRISLSHNNSKEEIDDFVKIWRNL